MTKPRLATAGEAVPEESEAARLIEAHGGDAMSAVNDLVGQLAALRRELALTRIAVSRGFSRGWHHREGRPE